MGNLPRSNGNVARKGICSVIGVKALTVGVVSVLLWDRAVVDESLDGAFLPTVEEIDVEILVVSVAFAICANASAARLVLEVDALVVQNTNEEL